MRFARQTYMNYCEFTSDNEKNRDTSIRKHYIPFNQEVQKNILPSSERHIFLQKEWHNQYFYYTFA